MNVERIEAPESWDGSEGLLALVISHAFSEPGVTFFTDPDAAQQLAYIQHPAGHVVAAHTHYPVPRTISRTQEVLLVRRGRMVIDFYTSGQALVCSREVGAGDVVALLGGGHGMTVLDDVELFEVKQGPYLSRERDKLTFFPRASDGAIRAAGG